MDLEFTLDELVPLQIAAVSDLITVTPLTHLLQAVIVFLDLQLLGLLTAALCGHCCKVLVTFVGNEARSVSAGVGRTVRGDYC